MAYLLDTGIISDMMRHPRGLVARRVATVGAENVRTSIIVLAELRFGLIRRNAVKLAKQLEEILEGLEVVPFDAPAEAVYGQVRTQLELRGELIGPMDLLIASQALALGDIVVTANEREFSRVEGLRVENWLR